MRVVYLADAPYIHTRRWVEHFASAGWEAHVVSFRPAAIEGAEVHHIHGLERLGKLRYLAHARRVRRLVRQLQPDLLHAMHLTSYGFLATLCGRRPLLTSVWGTDILEAPGISPLHGRITRHALAKADQITATGLRLANATLPYAPEATPVTVVPYGVDLDRFRPQPRETTGGPIVVGSVGRLSPEKGFDVLLRAAASLVGDGVPIRIVLAGDGPEREKLTRLAGELGIVEAVGFLGEIEHADVPSTLAGLDIFAIPSTAEGFGVAAIEAAAMTLPVVGSDVHGIPDVVTDGRTGILTPPGDAGALAASILTLVGNAELRATLGAAGRALVEERYRWEENAAQMERIYAQLVESFTEETARATVTKG